MVLRGCHRSVAPVKDADVAGLVPSWCATSHRRQRRRRHQPRRRRQATLGFDRPQDSNATGVPDDSATPLVSESVLGVFLGSPAATPRLESETPVAFDLRSAHATRLVRHKMHLGNKYKFNSPASPSQVYGRAQSTPLSGRSTFRSLTPPTTRRLRPPFRRRWAERR